MKHDPKATRRDARDWWQCEPITATRVPPTPGQILDGVLRDARTRFEMTHELGRDSSDPRQEAPLVLLVEDDIDLRELYAESLGQVAGARVAVAFDGADGLVKARLIHPDVVVTDFSMPVMNGGVLAARLAADQDTRLVPLVMISALADAVPRKVRLSCAAFLAKPCEPDELSRLVTLILAASAEPQGGISIPRSIREAIRAASRDEASRVASCRLFATDAAVAAGLCSRGDIAEAGLEHAIARGMLDGWAHGTATAQDVGEAYASLASKLQEAF